MVCISAEEGAVAGGCRLFPPATPGHYFVAPGLSCISLLEIELSPGFAFGVGVVILIVNSAAPIPDQKHLPLGATFVRKPFEHSALIDHLAVVGDHLRV